MFEIEKNIPIPISVYNKYPFGEMEVGDSFFVSVKNEDRHVIGNNIRSAARSGRWGDGKFTTKWIKAETGYRCWRIE